MRKPAVDRPTRPDRDSQWTTLAVVFAVWYFAGYGLGYLTKDMIFTSYSAEEGSDAPVLRRELRLGIGSRKDSISKPKFAGEASCASLHAYLV